MPSGFVDDASLEHRSKIDLGALVRWGEPEEERGPNRHCQRKEQHIEIERGG
jgi:hypothetical protein